MASFRTLCFLSRDIFYCRHPLTKKIVFELGYLPHIAHASINFAEFLTIDTAPTMLQKSKKDISADWVN